MSMHPIGYGRRMVTLDELEAVHGPRMHPEYRRRLFAWLASTDGIGIGGGWRATGTQPNKPGFAPEGKSFHQSQRFASGIDAYCAVDLVVAQPFGVHRAPFWAEVPEQGGDEADRWGVHCNIASESWHMQPIEIDGWATWVAAGRRDPVENRPLPTDDKEPSVPTRIPISLRQAVESAARNPGGGRLGVAWGDVLAANPAIADVKRLDDHKLIIEHIARHPGSGALSAAWTVLEVAA